MACALALAAALFMATPVDAPAATHPEGWAPSTDPTTTSVATTTTAPPPTTAPPSTTTTTAAPPTTAPPPPAPDPDPGTGDLAARVHAALADAIPPRWAAEVSAVEVIAGATSWGWDHGLIQISRFHASGPWWRLRAVVAHEVGHVIAFRYGSQDYHGAPPAGAPLGPGSEETWAECVAGAFTGHQVHPECGPDAVAWTAEWLDTN